MRQFTSYNYTKLEIERDNSLSKRNRNRESPKKIMKRYGINPLLRFIYSFNFEKNLKKILT